MHTPLVIFDLDGTLFHTAPDLLDSLNNTISSIGLEAVGFEDMTYLVGSGARAMINKALELHGTSVDDNELERLFDLFLDHYGRSMPGRSALYPGAADAMDRLNEAGMLMGVCTNKTESVALKLLDLTGQLPRFKVVTGGNTFAVRKPDPQHLLQTIEMAGAHPSAAVMIGDSVNDIAAAKDAGIPSIAVPFGYSAEPVETFEPDHIMQHYDELTPQLISRLLAGS
ncbi:MAG: phosphoglycolate phosphatase [Pseudomonadota bacterium]